MYNDLEVINTTAHVMNSAPESLVIGFPLICKMNVKICHDHIEAQYQGRAISINYKSNQVTLDTATPITIKPAQLLYLRVQQELTESDVVVATNNKEHMPKIQATNRIGYTNTSNADQILFHGMLLATLSEESEEKLAGLDTTACIDEKVPKPYDAMFKQLVKDYASIMSKLPGKYRGQT